MKTFSIGERVVVIAAADQLVAGRVTAIEGNYATVQTQTGEPQIFRVDSEAVLQIWGNTIVVAESERPVQVDLLLEGELIGTVKAKPPFDVTRHEPDDGSTPTLPQRAAIASPTAVQALDAFERIAVADYCYAFCYAFLKGEDTSATEEILAGLHFPDEPFQQITDLLTKLEAIINQALE